MLFDQSVFVKASVQGVIREAVIAACLTALMILLFLGSWRSTLVVATSIPLSILSSLIILGALGQTINIMTLGGLSLAVGILVDDATVEIENTNRNLAMGGKSLTRAILDGANQIAVPTLVATLSICIVFIPVVLPDRNRQVPVYAACPRRRLRHDEFVPAVAYPGSRHGAVPAAQRHRAHRGRRGRAEAYLRR